MSQVGYCRDFPSKVKVSSDQLVDSNDSTVVFMDRTGSADEDATSDSCSYGSHDRMQYLLQQKAHDILPQVLYSTSGGAPSCSLSDDVAGCGVASSGRDGSQSSTVTQCHVFKKYGVCISGLNCRFGGCHISDDGFNVRKLSCLSQPDARQSETKHDARQQQDIRLLNGELLTHAGFVNDTDIAKSRQLMGELNDVSQGVRSRLRRKQWQFGISKSLLPRLKTAFRDRGQQNAAHLTTSSEAVWQSPSASRTSSHEAEPNSLPIDIPADSNSSPSNCSGVAGTSSTLEDISQVISDCSVAYGSSHTSVPVPLPHVLHPSLCQSLSSNTSAHHLFYGKRILAPLTTVGNLPFRRLCVGLGAEVTVSEMALASSILLGRSSELALLKRHVSEKCFGIQLAGGWPNELVKCTELLCTAMTDQAEDYNAERGHPDTGSAGLSFDFLDINCACPLEGVHSRGGGSVLIERSNRLRDITFGVKSVLDTVYAQRPSCSFCPLLTVKLRLGHAHKHNYTLHKLLPSLSSWKTVDALFVHGRTSKQRYTKSADWEYLHTVCTNSIMNSDNDVVTQFDADKQETTNSHEGSDEASVLSFRERFTSNTQRPLLIGCGDILNLSEYQSHLSRSFQSWDDSEDNSWCPLDAVMVGRGALIKPWIFTELETGKVWDISVSARLELMQNFVNNGLEHWGSDERGVGTTRRFFLEWMSFAHRYVPVRLLMEGQHTREQKLGWRAPRYAGRSDMETKMCSSYVQDWIELSELFLGPVGKQFSFTPKHKSSSYEPNDPSRGV
eukprot:GHVQ01023606.1.p1 GENE.GHVQ01023606.1~~GHVQ01023606.1.p1  ORF type:complete len:784 (-),score=96.81 GHVQ01023606.1:640-2991(-)